MNNEYAIQNINIELIIPNRFQPRLTFDEQGLKELAASIKQHGIIQPLVLRKLGDKYEIIAGERRYKAATIAGLTEVPAIVTHMDDNQSAEVALVENVQRKNLNSLEEAKSYKKILDKGFLTQEHLAKRMGISQSAIANKLRLLNLSSEVQEALMQERISERHARSLLQISNLSDQSEMLNRIIKERLTVRQLDAIINEINNPKSIKEETIVQGGENEQIIEKDPVFEEQKTNFFSLFSQNQTPPLDDQQTSMKMEDIESLDFNEKVLEQKSFITEESLEDADTKEEIILPEDDFNTLDDILMAFHTLKEKISNSKFSIKFEEYDFTDLYQIIIKIKK